MEMVNKWQKDGWFEANRTYYLTAHGGDLNGMLILEGSREKLDELRRTDEFERFAMTMSMHFTNLGVVPGVTKEGIDAVTKRNPDMMK